MDRAKQVVVGGWLASAVTVALAVYVWAHPLAGQWSHLSTYAIFPVLGLVAFSLMWVHYLVGAARFGFGLDKAPFQTYFDVTGAVVLGAILLHPGLLIWQLWRDGQGLPPGSYKHYVGASLVWAVLLGSICLGVFLLFELRRWFGQAKWWWVVNVATDLAMLGIFLHALTLGQSLKTGWYRQLWLFYGVTLVMCLGVIYYQKYERFQQRKGAIGSPKIPTSKSV
jgi:hypothetical protein